MKQLTPTEIALKLMESRDHLVIGCPPSIPMPDSGDRQTLFGGAFMVGHDVIVDSETDRVDWDTQFREAFPRRKDKVKHLEGSRYFRCHLEEL